jgi:hypothetical protein
MNYKVEINPNKPIRHSKCKGFEIFGLWGKEYECGYYSKIDCDQCKYGGGKKDPEAKCNQ